MPKNFKVQIIFVGTEAECLALEYALRPDPFIAWNVNPGGTPKVVHTEEVRARMSEAAKNKPPASEETRRKISAALMGKPPTRGMTGKTHTKEVIEILRKAHLGKTRSEETRIKLSTSHLGNTSHLGFIHSEETKETIRLKKTGVPVHTEEHKQELRDAWKGNSLTKGKPWSAARRLAWLAKNTPDTFL